MNSDMGDPVAPDKPFNSKTLFFRWLHPIWQESMQDTEGKGGMVFSGIFLYVNTFSIFKLDNEICTLCEHTYIFFERSGPHHRSFTKLAIGETFCFYVYMTTL